MQPAIEVDLDAIRHNYLAFANAVAVPVIPIVKASAYGHGMVPVARTVVDAGAPMLGVVDGSESLALRAAGIRTPILSWIHSPAERWLKLISSGLDIGVSTMQNLASIGEAVTLAFRRDESARARIQLKVDTGLGRNGAREVDWRTLFAQARELERADRIRVVGLFSHLSGTSEAEDLAQIAAFDRARALAAEIGLEPDIEHLSATAGALRYPQARYDAVRLGIALYGLTPFAPGEALPPAVDDLVGPLGRGLRPALRLTAPIRRDEHGWSIEVGTADGLLPLGANGLTLVDDASTAWAVRSIEPTRTRIAPVGDPIVAPAHRGEPLDRDLVVIGRGASDAPTADDWAAATGTINYEITTRLGRRIPRRYTPQLPADGGRTSAWPPVDDSPLSSTSPRREAQINLDLIEERLEVIARRAGVVGADPGALDYAVDLSEDAYGHGLTKLLPIVRDAGLRTIARTEHDVARLRRHGIEDAVLAPDAPAATLAVYGFDPADPARPALSLRSELINVKRVRPGQGVSYGYRWRATTGTALGLIPLGYGDGIARRVEGRAQVLVGGVVVPIVGRVAMDQVVVDLGDHEAWPGLSVRVFGGERNDVSVRDWAGWLGIPPESICASLGERVQRVYTGRRA